MIKVLELPVDQDLSELSRELWVRKIGHQIRQTSRTQEIFLAKPEDYPQLMQLVQDWHRGELAYTIEPESSEQTLNLKAGLQAAGHWPLTALILLISGLVTAMISFEPQPNWLASLTIVPFEQVRNGLAYLPLWQTLQTGEVWRLLTPAFLHFGALHLIFNSLWVWELGRMIERQQSTFNLALLFLVSGISANLAQYLMGDILFGGLSGVVYALLGYCWFWDRFARQPIFYIRKPVFVFLLIWLVFCLVGGASMLGLGEIANAAHVGGLVSGSLWALISVTLSGKSRFGGQ
ncbi:rhomboid family intramembrane serine protease [Oceanospirillum sanctuarii]|uniref:rhomboid family intramembrane serine protease n=1 Tax=Oceanospirillum sanctuarii TaxID=1434821 RepID=UPI000A382950|nr:rhomboid family intramembrane serine protease [Oceanospirillum sanctuarii]